MARRAFFSFHYSGDLWRAQVVANSWATQPDREVVGVWEPALWRDARSKGEAAVRELIDQAMEDTTVTVVLIGRKAANSPWVRYEIEKTLQANKGLVGVYIHAVPDSSGSADTMGSNPFDLFHFMEEGKRVSISSYYNIYDWVGDQGQDNINTWIERAAQDAGV